MKIAIIGSGISGMTASALLHGMHEITLFEANDYIGGHTHTDDVETCGERQCIDTGFIVFNEKTYPNFCKLLRQRDVASQPTEMSFSVRCDRTGLEYNGTSVNGVFAQRRNLWRPSFHRMLLDILRFNRIAEEQLNVVGSQMTVGEFLSEQNFSDQFARFYLLPMGAAIWSCPIETFSSFPIRFIIDFYANHGLLQIRNRPLWRTITGGSREYVRKLTAPYLDRIRLSCPVHFVSRDEEGVSVQSASGMERFDEVIFACHSNTARRLLNDADATEQAILSEFPYSRNRVVLHTDTSVLPRRRRAWASWNYHLPQSPAHRPTLTYCMNILQRIESPQTYCVTLNEDESIDPARVLGRYDYSHPIFTVRRAAAQQRHHELIRRRRTSFCGAYWGSGFHEDGVNSALAVCEGFGICRDRWTVAGTTSSPAVVSQSGLTPEVSGV